MTIYRSENSTTFCQFFMFHDFSVASLCGNTDEYIYQVFVYILTKRHFTTGARFWQS